MMMSGYHEQQSLLTVHVQQLFADTVFRQRTHSPIMRLNEAKGKVCIKKPSLFHHLECCYGFVETNKNDISAEGQS